MAAAPFVTRLLRHCPGLYLLATSQRLLSVPGEQQIEIEPMAAPVATPSLTVETLADSDSFKLFCDPVRLKQSDWTAESTQVPLIVEILTHTDGIPLSIELAAAWVDRIALTELAGIKKNRANISPAPAHPWRPNVTLAWKPASTGLSVCYLIESVFVHHAISVCRWIFFGQRCASM